MSEEMRTQQAIDPETGKLVKFQVRTLRRKEKVTVGKGGAIANPKRVAEAKVATPKAES